jgi:NAD(P)-dependent dehydrogenase (short-subunit alcohol dehydrogenase family)
VSDQEKPLEGRVAIVTGAARGLGREYALLLGSLGAAVVVNDLASGADVAAEIVAAGGRATVHQGDIARWDIARAMIDTALDAFGQLDVLVNNAGILRVSPVRGLSEEDWDRMISANLMATVAPIRAAMTYWGNEADAGRARAASLINTTSETALMGYPGRAAYGAGKAGVANLTVSLADRNDAADRNRPQDVGAARRPKCARWLGRAPCCPACRLSGTGGLPAHG